MIPVSVPVKSNPPGRHGNAYGQQKKLDLLAQTCVSQHRYLLRSLNTINWNKHSLNGESSYLYVGSFPTVFKLNFEILLPMSRFR